MAAYECMDEMWLAAYDSMRLVNQSSRDGDVAAEVIGWSGTLTDPTRCWLSNPRRCLSPYYWAAEVLWYASGSSSVEMIQRYAPQYARFADAQGQAYGAYGPRFWPFIADVVRELRKRPDSRRAVVGIWRPEDLWACHSETPINDLPCTLSWQFLARDGALNLVVTMRSNDWWLGLPYDAPWGCLVLQLVANELGLRLGQYHHHVGSLHVYRRNWEAAAAASHQPWHEHGRLQCSPDDTLEGFKTAALLESSYRSHEWISEDLTRGRVCTSLVNLCIRYLSGDGSIQGICQPLLEAAEQFDLNKQVKGRSR